MFLDIITSLNIDGVDTKGRRKAEGDIRMLNGDSVSNQDEAMDEEGLSSPCTCRTTVTGYFNFRRGQIWGHFPLQDRQF